MQGLAIQVLATVIVCYGCLGMGITFAWPSSTLLLFTSDKTTLARPMSEGEASLLGSLSAIGSLVGNPVMGVLMGRIGRKYCAAIALLAGVVGWALIVFTTRVEVVLTAIFIFGFSGTIFLVAPVYISEFCHEDIRGTMTSMAIVANGLGMLVSNLLGSALGYHTMTRVFLGMSVAGFVLLVVLKESPMVLMQKGKEEEAKKAVGFYRNCKPDSKEVLQEIEKMKRAINPNLDAEVTSPEEEKLNPEKLSVQKSKNPPTFLELLKKSRSTRQAMYVMLVLMTAAIFQGLVVVVVYAIPLFAQIIPASVMSPVLCSVLLCSIGVVASLMAGFLMDKAGRRMLMIVSSFLTGACCVVIGSLILFEWGPKWLIAVFIYLYSVTFTLGAGTVPYVMIAEVFLPEVKDYMTMLVLEWALLCSFCLLYIFQPIVARLGIGPVFFVFAAISFLTAAFCVFFMPETKGLSVDVIQALFLRKRKHVGA